MTFNINITINYGREIEVPLDEMGLGPGEGGGWAGVSFLGGVDAGAADSAAFSVSSSSSSLLKHGRQFMLKTQNP